MWIVWVLLIVAIVWIIVKAVSGNESAGGSTTKSARQILEERYARGEIDREEFEQKRRDLTGG